MSDRPVLSRWIYLAALMLAGESIYMLPYMRRTFQTSMEDAFGVTATQLGTVNAMFGVLALLCYFPGGWLADRVPARHLLTFSLLTTGLGGFVMMGFPGYTGLLALHAFWGVTSILTFWAALIKATREWGGRHEQGIGFGLLDGGRGAVGALLASLATYVFATAETVDAQLRAVLWVYSTAPIAAGVLVWLVLPGRLGDARAARDTDRDAGSVMRSVGASRVAAAARMPEVWLLAFVIFAAYWLYVGSFEFPAYVERAYGQSRELGAVLGTFRDWLRPVAAIGAGLLADRVLGSRVIASAFGLLIVSYGSLWLAPPAFGGIALLWAQVSAMALAVFALRGIYYALMEEGGVPRRLTGVTVGIVSVIGFVPDTFAFIVSGWFADTAGAAGYRSYFGLLAAVAVAGLVATWCIHVRRKGAGSAPAAQPLTRDRPASARPREDSRSSTGS